VYALFFLLPLIIFYEVGTILINTDLLRESQVRVVAFAWLQEALQYIGMGGRMAWAAPPLVVVLILLGLQLASRKSWEFKTLDAGPMVLECITLATPLIVLGLFINTSSLRQAAAQYAGGKTLLADIVTGIGAGIYEELVFRLVLICLLMLLLQDVLGLERKGSLVASVLVSSVLFSAHHHVVFVSGRFAVAAPFEITEFAFRSTAGVYFAALFAIRGFGITAGTHAFYDIIAVVINSIFF
jgi:membrane protease YdiL (CAAX protease family)